MLGNRALSQELIDLGERIRARRQECNLSQEALSEKAGISPNTVSRIEGGQMAMSIGIFRRLVKALAVDANILLGAVELQEKEEQQFRELLCRIRYLENKEQKIVMQTAMALIDGLEKAE